jgi:hypothetical protein
MHVPDDPAILGLHTFSRECVKSPVSTESVGWPWLIPVLMSNQIWISDLGDHLKQDRLQLLSRHYPWSAKNYLERVLFCLSSVVGGNPLSNSIPTPGIGTALPSNSSRSMIFD